MPSPLRVIGWRELGELVDAQGDVGDRRRRPRAGRGSFRPRSATASSVRSSVIASTRASLTSSSVWSRAGSTALRSNKMLRLALRPIVEDSSPSSASKIACAMRPRSSSATSGRDCRVPAPVAVSVTGRTVRPKRVGDLGQRLEATPGILRPGRGCRCTRCAPRRAPAGCGCPRGPPRASPRRRPRSPRPRWRACRRCPG